MGRVIRAEVVGVRCELATPRGRSGAAGLRCDRLVPVMPVPVHDETALLPKLRALTEEGWAFIMSTPMRAYCPAHAVQATRCSCSGRAPRRRNCPVHGMSGELVWRKGQIPDAAAAILNHFDAGRIPR